jgi:phage terminase large subunit-like protein
MSALAERVRIRVCVGCGEEFEDRSRTAPRSYCDVCRAGGQRAAPEVTRVKGRPFTVSHFRLWSRRFRLKGGGRFELEPWQAVYLEDLFARERDGRPTFSELWLVVPEGNGKTTFFTLVALYVIEFTPEAWVPIAASARDQAVDLTYRIASGFVERNELTELYRLHPGYRSIVHRASGGAMKIFASDAGSGDGVDPTLALIEELHRLVSMDLYETWSGKLEKSNGQLIVASTAGEPGSAFEDLRERIRQAADDMTREGCFVRAAGAGVVLHEYAVPEGGDCEDLELVASANPSARITRETLGRKRAKPSWNPHHWARFTCNLPTRGDDAAITEQEWHEAATAEKVPKDVEWWAGMDFGWRRDTTALVPLAWVSAERRQFAPATILVPPRDGSSLKASAVRKAIMDAVDRYGITTFVMDTNRAEDIASWVSDDLDLLVVDRAQSNGPQSEDYERFMEALRSGALRHAGDQGLRAHALNAITKPLDGGKLKFARRSESRVGPAQDRRVIDALVAAAMVHSVAVEQRTAVPVSTWRAV